MIASKRSLPHAGLAVPKEISTLTNVEGSILQVEWMPFSASILFPKFTHYIVGLVQALGHHCVDPNRTLGAIEALASVPRPIAPLVDLHTASTTSLLDT
jgi:hypothetical protein